LSPKTIEFHLGNAFRKLDVRTRTGLARAVRPLAATGDPGQFPGASLR
jgi:DNA-binding CsgD family transcriptional regulator